MELLTNNEDIHNVFFTDIFINVSQYLLPTDLYKLKLLCKKYNKIITPDTINTNIIQEINRRLQTIFGNNYTDFIQVLKISNSAIICSFIADCIRGEIQDINKISICVPNPCVPNPIYFDTPSNKYLTHGKINTPSEDRVSKFMIDKNYKYEYTKIQQFTRNKVISYINISTFKIDNNFITIVPLEDINETITISEFVNKYSRFNTNINIYTISSNHLYIHDINGILNKYINFQFPVKPDHNLLCKKYDEGYKFYKHSDPEKKIMSNEDILSQEYNIIKVNQIKSGNYIINTHDNNEYILDEDKIYLMTRIKKYTEYPIFDVVQILRIDKEKMSYHHLFIKQCVTLPCLVNSLFPSVLHYHCEPIGRSFSIKNFYGVILVLN